MSVGLTSPVNEILVVEPPVEVVDNDPYYGTVTWYRNRVYDKNYEVLSTGFNYGIDWSLPTGYVRPNGTGGGSVPQNIFTAVEELAFLQDILSEALVIYNNKYPNEPPGRGWLGNTATYNCLFLHNRLEPIISKLVSNKISEQKMSFVHWDISTIVARGALITGQLQHVYLGITHSRDVGGTVSLLGLSFTGPLPVYFADPWRSPSYNTWQLSNTAGSNVCWNDPNYCLETVVRWGIHSYPSLDSYHGQGH